jgi:arginase family enzyme
VDEFYEFVQHKSAKFTLFGSGDFHYVTALWLRRITRPFTLISFDNHPDWDIRPPRWCCGTWMNRALELPTLAKAVIWGCGNFELNWPNSLFVSRKALRSGRLQAWAWSERLKASRFQRWPEISRGNWRERFSEFVRGITGEKIYVTIDLDCLNKNEATTNWENGLFEADDIVWALTQLRSETEIVGGDVCGAYSKPKYERLKQRIEASLDHPDDPVTSEAEAAIRNERAFRLLWHALTGSNQRHTGANQHHAEP